MNRIIALIILTTNTTLGQTTGVVTDSFTGRPVPYTNIWVSGKNAGTSADKNGSFVLHDAGTYDTLVFSAIGYKTSYIPVNRISQAVKMAPEATELDAVTIYKRYNNKKTRTGRLKRSAKGPGISSSNYPLMLARYFPYKEEYGDTPFLDTIELLLKNYHKNYNYARFNIRLYHANENGYPGSPLYHNNIIGEVTKKRKSHLVEINVSDLDIQIPEGGFFVAVELLIIDENKYEHQTTMLSSGEKKTIEYYAPTFQVVLVESNDNSFIYMGEWVKMWKSERSHFPSPNSAHSKEYTGKYPQLAVELILSN